MKLCSACLLGIHCRYDGKIKTYPKIMALAKKEVLIPVCPEQLGGLPTPREPCEQNGRKVFTESGEDVTASFVLGAEQGLKIAKIYGIKDAILKARSPSCGSGKVYDGSFSGNIVQGDGVTADLLKKNGIRVLSEEEL
jgi:uncharacterized protein YbbK (DUF523 family)